jgi:hypothetical protein
MIKIKPIGNQWRIESDEPTSPAYRNMDEVFLHILRGRMDYNGVITCANLFIYVEGENPVDDRKIGHLKKGATHLNLVPPNGEFFNSMYSYKDKIYGNNY